jgi:16S rRNA (guanine(527)-N(7))-methyltransferase RsmG
VEQPILDKTLELIGRAGAPALDGGQKKNLGEFLGEVVRWGSKVHLVGKGDLPGTVSALVLDSLLLLETARRAGILGGGALSGDGARAAQDARGDVGARGAQGACGNSGALRARVADIGSGAGFPGIVWKIGAPELDITLFERREKQQIFLGRVAGILGIDGLHVDGRDAAAAAEEEPFDVVISKAAGRLPALLPLSARLLRGEGCYCTTKGKGWKDEIEAAASKSMRLEIAEELPLERGFMLIFRKTALPEQR